MAGHSKKGEWTRCTVLAANGTRECGAFGRPEWGGCWHHLMLDPERILGLVAHLKQRLAEFDEEPTTEGANR